MTAVPAFDAATSPMALLFPELNAELAVTRDFLSRVPWEQAAFKPHERSMSLRSLAAHVAQMPGFLTAMAAMDVLDFKPEDFVTPPLASTDELVALFDAECEKMHAALAGMDSARLNATWKMTMGGATLIEGQRAYLLRQMGLNHLVHHRAQLGVFLRLLNVKIPGSYGPSADTV